MPWRISPPAVHKHAQSLLTSGCSFLDTLYIWFPGFVSFVSKKNKGTFLPRALQLQDFVCVTHPMIDIVFYPPTTATSQQWPVHFVPSMAINLIG